jgi:uncharacterized OB-fold protein
MSLTEKITKTKELTAWEDGIPVHYLYTYGVAGEKFFRGISEKETFLAARCAACDTTYVPPRIYCEKCFAELKDYIDAGTAGEVHSFTVCHKDMSGNVLPKPKVIAFVKIDKTDGGIIHELDCAPEKAKIGMKVKALFKEKTGRTGGITDIICFR